MMRDNPTKGSSRVKLKGHHIKAFTNSVGALEQLGVEAGGTAVDPKEQDSPCVFGSSWGFSFFKDKPLTPAAQSKKSQLKTKVCKLYSDSWTKARGKSRVLYLEIKGRTDPGYCSWSSRKRHLQRPQ